MKLTHYKIYRKSNELPSDWDGFVRHDVFLQSNYIKALEVTSPNNISWFYVGIFKSEQLVGVAIIQRVELYLEDIFRNYKDSCFKQKFKHFISKFLKGNMLVTGNLMHTGQHGIFFDAHKISQEAVLDAIFKSMLELKHFINTTHKKNIRIIMLKDYFTDDAIHNEIKFFNDLKIHKITVQPNMILNIQANWVDFDTYLSDLNKKYRQRYKIARKKAGQIVKKELNIEAVHKHSKDLHLLYKTVSDNAKINTFILTEGHFYELKSMLKENFKVFGYYLDDTLIGFYTLICNDEVLETYFLGYNEAHQYPNQMYLNMLYDMVEFAIRNKFSSIVYARTAMEIKSSIGAKPETMHVYLKHTNPLVNAILNGIFKLMNPTQDWEERHPFK